MALCNDTKSQFACREKISPFLSLDMAAGADQVVWLRFRVPLQVSLSPLCYLVNVCWPRLCAQHCAVSETQAFSTLPSLTDLRRICPPHLASLWYLLSVSLWLGSKVWMVCVHLWVCLCVWAWVPAGGAAVTWYSLTTCTSGDSSVFPLPSAPLLTGPCQCISRDAFVRPEHPIKCSELF